MKCSSGSSDGGDDPRTPAPADAVGGESSEPSKKQRTEEPSASSSGAGECSSSFPLAPPEHASPSGEEGQARVPDLGEDLVFEVLMRAEARTLASAACVSRAWRQLASDERLWEATCVREWVSIGYSEQMLRRVVLRLGGFRRLHELYIRPIQQQRRGAGPRMLQVPARINRDQLQVSLSLLSTSFFQNMPSAPPAPKKKDKDNDNNGGGKCG
jgi:F-box protein GID2